MYTSCLSLAFAALIAGVALYLVVWFSLPDVSALIDTPMQAPLQVYTQDHQLIAEFGHKQRVPVEYHEIPQALMQAIVATEDQRFFEHGGVDIRGVARAALSLVKTGQKHQGASTITMQVARNFYLTRKKTFTRKVKEVLLAIKIDQVLSKAQILTLYCNKIYFGNRSYGIGAAARNYYGQSLDALTLPQMAMIAGLPQAPSRLNPLVNPEGAKKRRDHVLGRMLEQGYLTQGVYEQAIKAPITAQRHNAHIAFRAPYLAEQVRRDIIERFGADGINWGLKVIMSVDSHTQQQAQQALKQGLIRYDYRHGFRLSHHTLPLPAYPAWSELLSRYEPKMGLMPMVVLEVSRYVAWVKNDQGVVHALSDKSLQWAMYRTIKSTLLPQPMPLSERLHVGDVVWVKVEGNQWHLRQVPQVQGALVSLNPKNGAILAMVGGLSDSSGGFNRATQALRQPGSGFKPFIYACALEADHMDHRYTLATQIEDSPVVVPSAGEADEVWRPSNDQHKFYGALTLRKSLMRSNNLITVRMLRDLGVDYVHNYLQRFGFDGSHHPRSLSLALGSGVVTPMQMTAGYAMFANGGRKVEPYLIEQVFDQNGRLIFDHDQWSRPPMRHILPTTYPILSESTAFLMDSALQSVIKHGTGRRALSLHRSDLAGKTGSTNGLVDAWFIGYQPSVVTGVWVGFDDNRPTREYGARAALPIWTHFMGQALSGHPMENRVVPDSVVMAWVDKDTDHAFVEYFADGTQPDMEVRSAASGQEEGLF